MQQGGGEKIIRAVVLREAGRGKGLPLWMTKTIELGDEVRIARDEVESEGGKEKPIHQSTGTAKVKGEEQQRRVEARRRLQALDVDV